MLHPEYVIEHTQKVKGKNRYNLFNPSETKTNKRKKRDESGIDITNEPMVRRKRKPQDDDDDENYIPLNVTREERYAQRVNRVPPPYTYVVKTAERKDGITYRRKVYTFLNRDCRIMYRTLWAQENKFEKLKRLSNWNQVNGRYFWLTYYTSMKILHNSSKVEPIFENLGPFLMQLNGTAEGEPIVNDNEYAKKYTRKINRVRDGLPKL